MSIKRKGLIMNSLCGADLKNNQYNKSAVNNETLEIIIKLGD